jgi:hypothetical protein
MYTDSMRRHAPLFCVLFTAACAAAQVTGAVPPEGGGISIKVLQGDGAINSIRLHHGHDPVIQVVDASGEPVANATVTFLLPATGPSGTFGESGLSVTMQTDARGMAATHGFRPNDVEGRFRIRVTASWRGQAAVAEVTEINAEPVAKSHRSRTIAILAALGGGAAVAAAVALGHGGGSSSPSGSTGAAGPGATIAAGTPSLGPPH